MNTEINQDGAADVSSGGEGTVAQGITLTREQYDELVQIKTEHGSLKRDFKDLKKSYEEATKPKDTPQNQPDEFGLLHKLALKASGVNLDDEDEVSLAREVQKKTGIEWDKLGNDDYFTHRLNALRTTKANAVATSNIRGGTNVGTQKDTADYWIAKGAPPTASDVPNRKTRAKIARAFLDSAKAGKTFYND